ncbi:MAG: MFS transporter [Ardenticatenaceae bacterium]|nr:MFS transporter [Ardenticatenaceae bacterium]
MKNAQYGEAAPDPTAVREDEGGDERSFRELVRIRSFRDLWFAQALSQTAHNGIHFVELIMIARLTQSSGHVGIMILAFSLPAVFFSASAGVIVDRLPKRRILFYSNLVRIFTALSYIAALHVLHGRPLLLWVYSITFFASAIGQFFAPAEAAMIPLLVGRRRLLTANSLFNLTMTATQVLGLIIIFPLLVKIGALLLGAGREFDLSFAVVASFYAVAAWLVRHLPADKPQPITVNEPSAVRKALREIREGWAFIRDHKMLWVPMVNLSMTATLVMILATIAPNFAAHVLRVSQEDAVYIFAPAGIGMVLGTFLIGRFGHRLRRESLSNAGMVGQGVVVGALGLAGWVLQGSAQLIFIVAGLALLLGFGFAAIGIPAQTMLQERTPARIRGRVFSVQFLLANLFSIPPMLFAGTLADRISIPPVAVITAMGVLVLAAISVWITRRYEEREAHAEEVEREWRAAEHWAELEAELDGATVEQLFTRDGARRDVHQSHRQELRPED